MVVIIALIVFEIVFAVYCIKTGSFQTRIRGLFRIGALAGSVLLILSGVIKWSIRYYAFAVFIIVFAGFGALELIGKNKTAVVFKIKRIVVKGAVIVILAAITLIPVVLFPGYEPLEPSGKFNTRVETFLYEDTSRIETYSDTYRNRILPVDIYFPDNAGMKLPLVIYSHGAFGTKTGNLSLCLELASHGYIVCAIDHTYQCLYTEDENGKLLIIDTGYLWEVLSENARLDRNKSYEYYRKWMEIRVGDIEFVIDKILDNANNNDTNNLYEMVDSTKIGVVGHSLGGSAALGAGRIMDKIGAVVVLEAPFLYDITGVSEGEFVFLDEIYPVPVLNIYTDSSWNYLSEWPQYAQNYRLLTDDMKGSYNIHISGSGHLSITDLALTSPVLTRILNGHPASIDPESCLRKVNEITLEHFNKYLK